MNPVETPAEIQPTNRLAHLTADSTTSVNAHVNKSWKIPGDQVTRGLSNLSEEARDAFKWLAGYAQRENLTPEEVGAKLHNRAGKPYSADSVVHVYYGRREESELSHMLEEVNKLRKVVEAREGMTEAGFVETSLTRAIFRCCERAFLRRRITFIFGESQVGKTTALKEYARLHNHGQTILVRMPTKGTLGNFLDDLAVRLNIPITLRNSDKRRRVKESFDDRTLLIVDECHQALSSTDGNASAYSLEFVREIHDEQKCGVVLCGTNVFRDGMQRGSSSRVLRQLWLRGFAPLQLPAVPSTEQRADFAKAFGLAPAQNEEIPVSFLNDLGDRVKCDANPFDLEKKIVEGYGLGRWVAILQEASDYARESRKSISWAHVIKAHERFKAMEQLSN